MHMHGPAMLARACPEPLFSAMPFVDEAQLRVMLEVAISSMTSSATLTLITSYGHGCNKGHVALPTASVQQPCQKPGTLGVFTNSSSGQTGGLPRFLFRSF